MKISAFKKFDLTGKTAVVTGGATGIGYFMARGLALSGAKVILAARREDTLKASAARMTEETGNPVTWRVLDLASRKSTRSLVEYTNGLGGVDIFIGNAALDVWKPLEGFTDEDIDSMFHVNVIANIELTRDFLPHMRKNKWGRIIYSSSATTRCGSKQDGMTVYTANKGALNTFTQTVAAETGEDGITVNSIILGMYQTEMQQAVVKQLGEAGVAFEKTYSAMTAAGRLGRCEEVEGLIQLVASDAGSYITGAHLAVDGGMSIMLRPNNTP
jgi:gluconate 5-dehydrogenase